MLRDLWCRLFHKKYRFLKWVNGRYIVWCDVCKVESKFNYDITGVNYDVTEDK